VSSLALARSGFTYTGHRESTVCTECQLVVDIWQQGDQPGRVHRQRSPSCAFVREHLQANDTSSTIPATERLSPNYDITGGDRTKGSTTTDFLSTVNITSNSCLIDRNNPDLELLSNEDVRFSTFHDWPERAARVVNPRELAKAGLFYTGQADRVQCAFCLGCLHGWEQGDRPANEHDKHFPDCSSMRSDNKALDVLDHTLLIANQV